MQTDKSIRTRKTDKVLGDPAAPWPVHINEKEYASLVQELLELASCAPFHYPLHKTRQSASESVIPWRFYVWIGEDCRNLLTHVQEQQIDVGKIANMLAAADALIHVTWLPDPKKEIDFNGDYEPHKRNTEHIAGTAAAIQNLLLGATARNIPNYWSSGGKLREAPMTDIMGIGADELPLGSLFLFPKDIEQAIVKPGAHRGKAASLDWVKRWKNPGETKSWKD